MSEERDEYAVFKGFKTEELGGDSDGNIDDIVGNLDDILEAEADAEAAELMDELCDLDMEDIELGGINDMVDDDDFCDDYFDEIDLCSEESGYGDGYSDEEE